MHNRWLFFLVIGFFSVVTVLFYWIRTNPIDLTPAENHTNPVTISEPTVTFVNPSRGATSPKVTIVEFSDFACEHCQSIQPSLDAVVKAFPNDVQLVWKNLPNASAHPESIPAAIAAHCADRQDAFWKYHDLLFARQRILSQDVYLQIADELKLDHTRFASCLASQDTMGIVQKDLDEGLALGIVATPALFIGSEKVIGVISTEDLVNLVQAEIQKHSL